MNGEGHANNAWLIHKTGQIVEVDCALKHFNIGDVACEQGCFPTRIRRITCTQAAFQIAVFTELYAVIEEEVGFAFECPVGVGKEFAFTEWTDDGRLRHPSYLGERDDKDAREVVREQPQNAP